MKVYIVEASSGSYDDYHWWIHGIFMDPQQADIERDKINEEWESKKRLLPPFPLDEDGDFIDTNLSEEEMKLHWNWWGKTFEAEAWNGAVVKEYEIEKVYR